MKRIDRVVRDDTIVLPLVSTIGRGPRGKGVYAETLTETDDTFKFVLKDWDTGQVVYTSPNLSSGELWVEHNSVYVDRGGSVVEYPLEITAGEPGGRLYTCSRILPRGFRNLYTVPVTDLNLYGKTLYPSRPDPREGDLVYFIMEDDEELRYLSMGCVMAFENDEVVFFAETYCPFSPYSIAVEDVLDRWATSGKLIDIFAPYIEEVVLANLEEYAAQVEEFKAQVEEYTEQVVEFGDQVLEYRDSLDEYALEVNGYEQTTASCLVLMQDNRDFTMREVNNGILTMREETSDAEARLQNAVDELDNSLGARLDAAIAGTARVAQSGTATILVEAGESYTNERIAFPEEFDEIPNVFVEVTSSESSTYYAAPYDVDEERFYVRVRKDQSHADEDTNVNISWYAFVGTTYDEIMDARVSYDGTEHVSLSARLNSDYAYIEDQISEVSEAVGADVFPVTSSDTRKAVWINSNDEVELDEDPVTHVLSPHLKVDYDVGKPDVYMCPCNSGDIFEITGTGVSGDPDHVPAWMFLNRKARINSDGEWECDVAAKSTIEGQVFNETRITAPEKANWFVAQFDENEPHLDVKRHKRFVGIGEFSDTISDVKDFAMRQTQIVELEKDSSHRYFQMRSSSSSGTVYVKCKGNSIEDAKPSMHLDYNYNDTACYLVDCVKGGNVTLTGTGHPETDRPLYAFLTGNLVYSSGSWRATVIEHADTGAAITYTNKMLNIPPGAKWMIVNFDSTKPHSDPILGDPIAYLSDLTYEAQQAIVGDIKFCTESEEFRAFWLNTQYDRSDYTYTEITQYLGGDRPDQPRPIEVSYQQFGTGYVNVDVVKGNETVWSTRIIDTGTVEIYNLIPGMYTVIIYGDDEEQVEIRRNIIIEGPRRQIYCANMANIRDLGGLLTEDGSHTRYGRIYRGGRPDHLINEHEPGGPENESFLTEEDVEMLTSSPVSLSAQIDIRVPFPEEATSESAFGFTGDDYVNIMCGYLRNYDFETPATWFKNFFETMLDMLERGKNVYFHCQHGADRTGFMAFLLSAACGVLENEMTKDYEVTSFIYGARYRNDTGSYNYANMIQDFKALPGTKISDKARHYFVNVCGISNADFDKFRDIMVY